MAGTLGEFTIDHTNMEISVGENEAAKNIAGGGGILCYDSGISLKWTPEEQFVLQYLLSRYSQHNILDQYAVIAKALPDKSIRDVAFRCSWMNEIAKQRKYDWNSSEKNKEEKVTDGYNSTMMDCDNGISYKMTGGASGKLLEQNAQVLDKGFLQLSRSKIHENTQLLYQAYFNLLSVLNDDNMTEPMKQLPPLPFQLNEELGTDFLPLPSSSYMPGMMKQMHCPAQYNPCYNNFQPPCMPN